MPKRMFPGVKSPGLECTVCGSTQHEVLESKPRFGYIHRRRQCINGHRFSTWELEASEAERVYTMAGLVGKLIQKGKT